MTQPREAPEPTRLITTKISLGGRRSLRIIAALVGETQIEVLDRVLGAEEARARAEEPRYRRG